MRTAALLPGEDPVLAAAAARIVEAASGGKLRLEPAEGDPAAALARAKAALAGALPGGSRDLRRALGLHTGLRPVRGGDVDVVLVVENVEGLSPRSEHPVGEHAASASRVATREGCRRVAHAAFEYAARNARRSVTVVHRRDLTPLGDGLLVEAAREAARDYAGVAASEAPATVVADALVRDPGAFDVLLCPGPEGELLAAVAAARAGGPAFAPAAQMNRDLALFEAADPSGGAPALLRAGVLLLEHLNEHRAADRLRKALEASADLDAIARSL